MKQKFCESPDFDAIGMRVVEAEFVLLFGIWLGACFLDAPPAWAIAMWVPLFLVFAFLAGYAERAR